MRLNWVDYGKGLGIILVVYGHVLRGISSSDLGLDENFFFFSDSIIYSFHMPLFLLLSGLFAEKWIKKTSLKQGILEKAKYLLIPYLIWSFIQGIFNVVMSNFTNSQMTISSLLYDIAFKPYGQFWFVYFLFLMFVLYAVLRKFLTIPVMLGISIALFLINNSISSPYHIDMLLKNIPYFFLGAFLSTFNTKNIQEFISKKLVLFSSSIGFLLICSLLLSYPVNGFLKLLSAMAGILMVISISWAVSKVVGMKWIETIGKASMPIYLMHILAASGTRVILEKFLDISSIWIHIVLGTVVGIIAPYIFYLLIRNYGVSVALFGLKIKNNSKNDNTATTNSLTSININTNSHK